MVKFCVLLLSSSSKTQMLLLKKNSKNIDCFVVDSPRLLLTFVVYCLLFVIRKQYIIIKIIKLLRRPISASDQIPDRFYVMSIEFLSLRRRRLFCKTSLAARSEERLLYS